MRKSIRYGFLLALLAGPVGYVSAGQNERSALAGVCASENAATDEKLVACTKILTKGRLPDGERFAALLFRAHAFSARGRWEEALLDTVSMLEIDPHSNIALKLHGFLNYKLKRYGIAEDDFRFVIASDPSDIDSNMRLVAVMTARGAYADAELHLLKMADMFKTKSFVFTKLAEVRVKLGKHDLAGQEYIQALQLRPKDKDAFNGLMQLCYSSPESCREIAAATPASMLELSCADAIKGLVSTMPDPKSAYVKMSGQVSIWQGLHQPEMAWVIAASFYVPATEELRKKPNRKLSQHLISAQKIMDCYANDYTKSSLFDQDIFEKFLVAFPIVVRKNYLEFARRHLTDPS